MKQRSEERNYEAFKKEGDWRTMSKENAAKNLGVQRAESEATLELEATPACDCGYKGCNGKTTLNGVRFVCENGQYTYEHHESDYPVYAAAPALYDALQGLVFRHVKDYGPCFCERVHTDPIEHYDDCVKANAAVALANGVTSDESEGNNE